MILSFFCNRSIYRTKDEHLRRKIKLFQQPCMKKIMILSFFFYNIGYIRPRLRDDLQSNKNKNS